MAARAYSKYPSILRGAQQSRCVLSAMAEFAEKPLERSSIHDLLQMARSSPEERARHLHETMKIGLAKCSLRLSQMPFGFCSMPSVKKVTVAYTHNFRQVMEFEHSKGVEGIASADYQDLTRNIFNQHKGTMVDIAKGVFEFYEDINNIFGKVELADVREDLERIKDVEVSLDTFFTDRLTLRLLISHVQAVSARRHLRAGMVGVVNTNTQPIDILSKAYLAARSICIRDYKVAPELYINGCPLDEFLESQDLHKFPYVHTHLFYIFLELFKNAARASIERAQLDAGVAGELNDGVFSAHSLSCENVRLKIPPIRVTVPEHQRMWDRERSVKIADQGTGMTRSVLSKSFCYFFSSIKNRPTVAKEVSDFDRSVPLAGFGFGLPISRVMARYFNGDVDLNSIPGKGTDVYVYL